MNDQSTIIRWKAIIYYRSKTGTVDVSDRPSRSVRGRKPKLICMRRVWDGGAGEGEGLRTYAERSGPSFRPDHTDQFLLGRGDVL